MYYKSFTNYCQISTISYVNNVKCQQCHMPKMSNVKMSKCKKVREIGRDFNRSVEISTDLSSFHQILQDQSRSNEISLKMSKYQ